MKISKTLVVGLAAALSITACSGGGGGSSDPTSNNDGGTTGSSKTTPGVWQGTVTSPTTGARASSA